MALDIPNPDQAQILISALESAQTLDGGMVAGIDTATLLRQVRISTREPDQIVLQMQFIRTVVGIILNIGSGDVYPRRVPRIEQIECIRRIVYELGDTILLAKTGFGKSIVFQAVSILRPDKITILIVPLTMLAEEQRKTIARFPNSKPIVIDQSVVKVSNPILKPIGMF